MWLVQCNVPEYVQELFLFTFYIVYIIDFDNKSMSS